MNKKTKGLAAIVLGGALVLGTGGTFALWHDSATIEAAQVSTGHLRLEAGEVLDWNLRDPDGNYTPFDPENETLVAGQRLIGTVALESALAGTYMVADLDWDVSVSIGDVEFTNGATHSDITVHFGNYNGVTELTPASNLSDHLYVMIDVANRTPLGSGPESQDVTLDIADIVVTLTQRAPVA